MIRSGIHKVLPNQEEVEANFREKYGDLSSASWSPRIRWKFSYFTPDDHYEALVKKILQPESIWLDVGCGRDLFPSNQKLAQKLFENSKHIVGIDPDDTIQENRYIHEKHQTSLQALETNSKFDVITLRMVAEHIAEPWEAVEKLAKLTSPGGKVVVYTIFRWSPIPILTWLTPLKLHHVFKKILWGTEEKDTFPVEYKMNTRSSLNSFCNQFGFEEIDFAYLDDCRTLGKFRLGLLVELTTRRILNAIGLHYPEVCIMGVYQKKNDR